MGLLTRLRSFEGGLFFPPISSDTAARPVMVLTAPSVLRVPLVQSTGSAGRVLVSPGQPVQADTAIAEPTDCVGAVHSPVSGTVRRLVDVRTPYQQRVPAVEIETERHEYSESVVDGEALEMVDYGGREELLAALAQLGVDGPDVQALRSMGGVERIIVSGLDCEPGFSVNLRTLADHPRAVIQTAAQLHALLGARRTHLVVDDARRRLVAGLANAAHRTPVRVCPVPSKYPQDHPWLLVRAVTGLERPHSQSLESAGMWCTDAGRLMDIHRAVDAARPHTWQTVTISGDAVAVPGNYRFPLGSTLRDVVDQVGLLRSPRRIVVGSALRGVACSTPDVVLTKRTRCLAILRDAVRTRRDATGCVRCGACQDVCPVRLDPRALLDVAERGRFATASRLHPEACVSCGLCDFVCPSSLPLMNSAERCRDHVTSG